MRAVVLFSGGAASWAAARRTVEAGYDTTLLFTDTKSEDEDLYRFLDDAAADVGAPLVRIAEGRTIWEVFRDERLLGNTRMDPCSRILKREQSRAWLKANRDPADTVVVLGFDWTEQHRLERARGAWEPWQVDAPMTRAPYRLRSEILGDLEARGIEPPRLYRMGFEHNNCGGGCVKAGVGHFRQLLRVFPARYAEWERNEEGVRQHLGKNVSILRDRTGNSTEPLTLRSLRLGIESGASVGMWDDIGGCGCFDEDPAA
jgi:Phosphoadenosine phosphosulfate reductase family